MKRFIKITKTTVLLLTLMLTLSACNKDDDLEEIFIGKAWNLTFIQEGTKRIIPQNGGYILHFGNTELSFITPSGTTITGNWFANGASRTFLCNNITANGSIEDDAAAKAVLNILTNAIKYEGDANWIQIIEQPNNTYMQFYNR